MYKTIKELSKEIGVTVQAIHQAKNKLLENEKLNKKGNSFILNTKQQAIIKEHFNVKSLDNDSSNLNEASSNLKQELVVLNIKKDKVIEVLERELEHSKDKLRKSEEEKETLMKLLDQQQRLSLQSNQKIEILESRDQEKKEEIKEYGKKKWWQLF